MRRIRFAPSSLYDLSEIYDYIYARSPNAAPRLRRRIVQKLLLMSREPAAGDPYDPPLGELRRTFVQPYVVYYRYNDDEIIVVRILHGSRDHGPLLDDID